MLPVWTEISRDTLDPAEIAVALLDRCRDFLRPETVKELETIEKLHPEDASHVINTATYELHDHIPHYCFVGMHPSDGALFGVWPDIFAIELATMENELPTVSDSAKIPNNYRGLILVINDHGNMTLLDCSQPGQSQEIWSMV